MEIVGTVPLDQVPQGGAPRGFGMWTGLARQAIEACDRGEVLVVKVADRAEYKKMINGTSDAIRKAGYTRRVVAQDEEGGVRVFLKLEPPEHQAANGQLASVAIARRTRRPRSR